MPAWEIGISSSRKRDDRKRKFIRCLQIDTPKRREQKKEWERGQDTLGIVNILQNDFTSSVLKYPYQSAKSDGKCSIINCTAVSLSGRKSHSRHFLDRDSTSAYIRADGYHLQAGLKGNLESPMLQLQVGYLLLSPGRCARQETNGVFVD